MSSNTASNASLTLEMVDPIDLFKANFKQLHWGMRLMSILSILTLGLYSYVLGLCKKEARFNSRLRYNGEEVPTLIETRRVRLASIAFSMDLLVSLYFSATTPVLLKQGGLIFNRKSMPRPLFWFFALSGFVPTASMTITVLAGKRWQSHIRENPLWRTAHGWVALLAYFSWWIACAPVFLLAILGERRTLALLKIFSNNE